MKIELEQKDVEAIVEAVVFRLKPLINESGRNKVEDCVFDVKGLATYLGVNESWVYKAVAQGSIPYFKAGKYTRFRKADIDRWIESESIRPVATSNILQVLKNNR